MFNPRGIQRQHEHRYLDRCNRPDIHEYQKQEIMRQGADDIPNTVPIGSSTYTDSLSMTTNNNTVVGFRDFEIFFDTAFQTIPSQLTQGEITFNVSDYNNGQSIGNLVEITLGSFYFPKPYSYTTTQPDPYFYRRIYLSILGLPSTQASRGANGSQYNFEFQVVDLNSISVLLQPIKPSFYLQSILSAYNETRMHFTTGPYFEPISLPKTTLTIQNYLPGTNPAQFILLNGDTMNNIDSTIDSVVAFPYVLPVPVAVFITGFAPVPALNTPQGLFITQIERYGVAPNFTYTFIIPGFDFTTLAVPSDATMIVGKNRIAIPMRFTTVENRITNYTLLSKP
jgi:hypothetical protein